MNPYYLIPGYLGMAVISYLIFTSFKEITFRGAICKLQNNHYKKNIFNAFVWPIMLPIFMLNLLLIELINWVEKKAREEKE